MDQVNRPRFSRYRRAVSLRYENDSAEAPEITHYAEGLDADLTVRLARRFGVPVVEDSKLARLLEASPVGSLIPPTLYRAIAIVIDRLDRIFRR